MKLIFILGVLILSLKSASAINVVRAECSLFDLHGELVKKFPGYYCAFLKDGSWVSMDIESLSYFDSNDKLVWKKDIPYHHMIKTDSTQSYLVALGEESKKIFGCNTRFDSVEKIDIKTGKSTKFSLGELVKQIKFESTSLFIKKIKIKFENKNYDCDTTHVNSISQISIEKSNPSKGLHAGNWLVNLRGWDTIISLDVLSGKITGQFRNKDLIDSHDVQMFDKNNFLLYMNSIPEAGGMKFKTQIALMNIWTNNITSLSSGYLDFYQSTWGGIQKKDDDWLISYFDKRGYAVELLDKNFKVLSHFVPFPTKNKTGTGFQDAKIENLDSFFKNYNGNY